MEDLSTSTIDAVRTSRNSTHLRNADIRVPAGKKPQGPYLQYPFSEHVLFFLRGNRIYMILYGGFLKWVYPQIIDVFWFVVTPILETLNVYVKLQ